MDPRKIYYLRFLLEAHGHIGLLSTIARGRVLIHTSEGCVDQVKQLLQEIAPHIGLRRIRTVPLAPLVNQQEGQEDAPQ